MNARQPELEQAHAIDPAVSLLDIREGETAYLAMQEVGSNSKGEPNFAPISALGAVREILDLAANGEGFVLGKIWLDSERAGCLQVSQMNQISEGVYAFLATLEEFALLPQDPTLFSDWPDYVFGKSVEPVARVGASLLAEYQECGYRRPSIATSIIAVPALWNGRFDVHYVYASCPVKSKSVNSEEPGVTIRLIDALGEGSIDHYFR
ncbi:MAG: hypothetical protein JSS72_09310 [Armatimonadetes bacterium]|nr:hypothetical protein [Armatimonadota bacterium]